MTEKEIDNFKLIFAPFLELTEVYMSFDKFLLAVESRDLSQADKSIKSVFFFNFTKIQFLNDKIYSYTKKKLFGTWQFVKMQDWKVNIFLSFSGER